MNRFLALIFVCIVTTITLTGCNPYKEIAPVSGKVTFGGEPVAGITVVLQPEGGRPSMGRTKEDGTFEMVFSLQKMGAKVGPTKVWFDPFSHEPTGNPDLCEPSPLIGEIPGQYFSFIQDYSVEQKQNTLDIDIPKR